MRHVLCMHAGQVYAVHVWKHPHALHAHVNIMHAYAVHARAVYSAFYVGINIDMLTADIVGKPIFRAKSIIRVGILRKFW